MTALYKTITSPLLHAITYLSLSFSSLSPLSLSLFLPPLPPPLSLFLPPLPPLSFFLPPSSLSLSSSQMNVPGSVSIMQRYYTIMTTHITFLPIHDVRYMYNGSSYCVECNTSIYMYISSSLELISPTPNKAVRNTCAHVLYCILLMSYGIIMATSYYLCSIYDIMAISYYLCSTCTM